MAQIICKPYVILQLNKSTVHRGIPNTTDIDRPMFFIFCSPTEETNFPKDAVLSEEKNLIKKE